MCKIIYRGHIVYIHYLLHIIIIQKQQLNVWRRRRAIKKEIGFFIKLYLYSTADNSESVI